MLNVNDLKLLNRVLSGEDITSDIEVEVEKLKSKISLVCEQIEIQEEAQVEIAKIQDKIVALDKVGEKNEENETEEN